jgi:hypothetical protein
MAAMIEDPRVSRVIAPKPKLVRSLLIVAAGIALVGGLMTLWAVSIQSRSLITNRGLAYGATILLTGAFGFIFLWLWLANARLLIGQGQVGYRNILGRNRFWSAGEIARIVDMTVSYGKTSAPQHAIYLFGLDGKRLMALNPLSWEASELRDYLQAIQVPVDVRATPITAKEARR